MSTQPQKNMAVTPESLENREQQAPPAPAAVRVSAAAELAALRARIETARQIQPRTHRERFGLQAFALGRDAAIRAILGED